MAKLVKIWKSEISGFRPHQRDSFTSKTINLHIFFYLESIFGHFEPFLAKNGLKWPKSAFSSNWSLLFGLFLPVLFILHWTKKNILIWTLHHSYRGHNRPKTGQKWPKMAKIGLFFKLIIVICNFFANLTQTTQN